MNIFTSSELASRTKAVCDEARRQGCAIITTNGKADLAVIHLGEYETINEFVHAYDSWRMSSSVKRMRGQSAGESLSMDEIDAEIRAARDEERAGRAGR